MIDWSLDSDPPSVTLSMPLAAGLLSSVGSLLGGCGSVLRHHGIRLVGCQYVPHPECSCEVGSDCRGGKALNDPCRDFLAQALKLHEAMPQASVLQ